MNDIFQKELASKDIKKVIDSYLLETRNELFSLFEGGATGSNLSDCITKRYDFLLKKLCEQTGFDSSDLCLVALGGYGREEMSLYSDVDLLLLHSSDKKDLKETIDSIIYPLWNSGVEIGGVTRTVDECIDVAKNDARSLTSLFDARYLCGDINLYKALQNSVDGFLQKRTLRKKYILTKIDEHYGRLKKYGDSVFLSEPHLKEGEGGLRSYHSALWIAKANYRISSIEELVGKDVLDKYTITKWKNSLDFLLRVRCGIHLISNRKQDRLDFYSQEKIAEYFRPSKGGEISSIEEFMHLFYKHASRNHLTSERVINSIYRRGVFRKVKDRLTSKRINPSIISKNGEIIITSKKRLVKRPYIALQAWHEAFKRKFKIHPETLESIRRASFYWPKDISTDRKVSRIFCKMISNPAFLHETLIEMHETGILTKIIPEFKHLYHRVQYDAVHLYTVDTHTFFVVKELSKLASGKYKQDYPHFHDVYKKVVRPDILVMAALLHDIGKGVSDPRKHDEIGAEYAKNIMKNLGFSEKDQDSVVFLVRSHLVLSQLAFHRDISDPQLIENLATAVRTVDSLRQLFLLTFADIRASGKELWSSWKAELLVELYNKTYDILKGRGCTVKEVEGVIEKVKNKVVKSAREGESEEIFAWLHSMPPRYILNNHWKSIFQHYISIKDLNDDLLRFKVEFSESDNYHNITIVTKDSPGLFAKICAVFTKNNISILESQLYTGKNGHVVDSFKVINPRGRTIGKRFNWERVEKELREALLARDWLTEEFSLESETSDKLKVRRRRRGLRSEVIVDNDVSAFYTVLDIFAPDKVGLLFNVANWLYSNGYDINMAKVATSGSQAIDAFYIRDKDYKKIESKDEIRQIKEGLSELLE